MIPDNVAQLLASHRVEDMSQSWEVKHNDKGHITLIVKWAPPQAPTPPKRKSPSTKAHSKRRAEQYRARLSADYMSESDESMSDTSIYQQEMPEQFAITSTNKDPTETTNETKLTHNVKQEPVVGFPSDPEPPDTNNLEDTNNLKYFAASSIKQEPIDPNLHSSEHFQQLTDTGTLQFPTTAICDYLEKIFVFVKLQT